MSEWWSAWWNGREKNPSETERNRELEAIAEKSKDEDLSKTFELEKPVENKWCSEFEKMIETENDKDWEWRADREYEAELAKAVLLAKYEVPGGRAETLNKIDSETKREFEMWAENPKAEDLEKFFDRKSKLE